MIRIGTAILLAVLAGAAPGQTPPASPSEAETPKAPPTVGSLDLSAIDQSADACTDFYQYACGNWIKDNPVPEHQGRWVRSFGLPLIYVPKVPVERSVISRGILVDGFVTY